jgi:hypothetical protein
MIGIPLLVLAVPASSAADWRDGLALPGSEVLEQVLGYAQGGENDKILKTLDYLAGLAAEIEHTYGVRWDERIRKALEAGDPAVVLREIRLLILYDIKLLHRECLESVRATDKAMLKLRLAVTDYVLLAPFVQQHHPGLDEDARRIWREARALLKPRSPYADAPPFFARQLAKLFEEVEARLESALSSDAGVGD